MRGWTLARRLGGQVGLLFAVVLLSSAAITLGAALVARASARLSEPLPPARYMVVVRTLVIDSAREALAAIPGVRIVGERSVADVLRSAQPGVAGSGSGAEDGTAALPGSERLSVLEAEVAAPDGRAASEPPQASLAAIRAVPGVTDLIDLNARVRVEFAGRRSARLLPVGIALVALGLGGFAFGVARTSHLAAIEYREDVVVRFLLGADPRSLWTPLGFVFGLTTLLGALAAVLVILAAVWSLETSGEARALLGALGRNLPRLAVAVLLLSTGAIAGAALSARRAVLALTRRSVWACILTIGALGALGGPSSVVRAATDPDWQVLRSVARELASNRHLLHELEREQRTGEYTALRAVASDDPAVRQLSLAALELNALEVRRLREVCDRLADRRLELREVHRANFAPGPPIEPRLPPVDGRVVAGFHQTGLSPHLRTYHRGVAIRTRPGETVRATAAGRIAFASELAGFGPVVVISHGRRTFSIYGKIAEPLVVRGMQVDPGEPIARSGDEPGLLFFAVRERGKALDPVAWLRAVPPAKPATRSGGGANPPKVAAGYGRTSFAPPPARASCHGCTGVQ
ncbi:MAG TPA: peptidoglycan DD-metalloendopeptidase family protein [Candidatus Bathyarchaeia archaeon]|nr:peptidoglycan DD-metalloendopeptidase family protein [Candidatus Bathyarchaeia archaeon]